jgi:hypothetical protein
MWRAAEPGTAMRRAPGGSGGDRGGNVRAVALDRQGGLDYPVTACRMLPAAERADAFLGRWERDPAREWPSHLVVRTQPPAAGFEAHLSTLRGLSEAAGGCNERANPGEDRNRRTSGGDLLVRPVSPRATPQ